MKSIDQGEIKIGDNMVQAGSRCRDDRLSLLGMTALVTGGTQGIGHAVVEELAGLGARVHTCSRNEANLNACLHDWEMKGFQVTGSVCDVMSRGERVKLMDTVSSVFSRRLNILINNVGTNIWKPTVDYIAEEFSTVMTTNLEYAYHLCQLAHPLLKASGVGSIVCISAIAGVVALNVGSIYGASKGAINQLTKDLACKWAKDNIRSNCVAPWFIRTPLVEAINNVGTNIWKPTVDYTAEEFSTVMTTNLESAYHLCQLAHPLLKASGVGSIVCISSIAGVVALNVGSIYGASKGAINQLKIWHGSGPKTILGVIV
ncbi:tropinone reductase homolog At5g06060-like isoform X1 [Quercus lobata]|uniref:tropinone reductase homolog At5g06060-like isoform X1 n=1 Tax=Quercus lobata TaxID=97700 RepID=UPI0012451D80|nr:tropinone reductase homolog At5g06060-like isoform X1 [Quercus lobata]